MIVFIIGPGGVGKSTSGKILAKNLGFNFIDLDIEFCEKIALVGDHIRDKGYESYCKENSKLFYKLLKNINKETVFALSSGFLIHEQFKDQHFEALKKHGISILLLPSKSVKKSASIVVKRQLLRGFGMNKQDEKEKIIDRYSKYLNKGDITIFSYAAPEAIADLMKTALIKSYFHSGNFGSSGNSK